jgi:hypothetical protein
MRAKIQKSFNPPPIVRCTFTRMVQIGELKEHPRNPKEHPTSQIRLLAKVIETQGWRKAIRVSNLTGFITAGHGALQAAKLLHLAEVPVDFQDYASEELELADLVADNRIAELAEIDSATLKGIEESLKETNFDLELTGLDIRTLTEGGELVAITPKNVPTMSWFLLGVPLDKLDLTAHLIARARARKEIKLFSTINNESE